MKYIHQNFAKCANPPDEKLCEKCLRNLPVHPKSERQVYMDKPSAQVCTPHGFDCPSYVEIQE